MGRNENSRIAPDAGDIILVLSNCIEVSSIAARTDARGLARDERALATNQRVTS